MRDTPRAITPAAPYPERGYANPPRSWQVITTGQNLDRVTPAVVADLGRLLDLRTDIGFITLETDLGAVHVARDWHSDYVEEANDLLARIEVAPGMNGLTLHTRVGAAR